MQRIFFLVIILGVLPTCRHKRMHQTEPFCSVKVDDSKSSPPEAALAYYLIEVEDIECELCAQAVEQIMGSIAGVIEVSCGQSKRNDYSQCQFYVIAEAEVCLEEEKVNTMLLHEGFTLKKITRLDNASQ